MSSDDEGPEVRAMGPADLVEMAAAIGSSVPDSDDDEAYPDVDSERVEKEAKAKASFESRGARYQTSALEYFDAVIRVNRLPGTEAEWLEGVHDAELFKTFSSIFSDGVFNLERGHKSGRLHWQVRMKVRSRMRYLQLENVLKAKHRELISWPKGRCNWQPTSSALMKKAKSTPAVVWEYVEKADTRVRGPYRLSEVGVSAEERAVSLKAAEEARLATYPVNVRSLTRETMTPMQSFIMNIVDNPEYFDHWDRIIWLVYEPVGNTGKSLLYSWCEMMQIATCEKPKELCDLQRAYQVELIAGRLRKWIMLDLSRNTDPAQITACLHAMEGVKGGRLTEDRNHHVSMRIPGGPPHMMIFMNDPVPDFDVLTHDRFRMIYVDVPEKMRAPKFHEERFAVASARHISVREVNVIMDNYRDIYAYKRGLAKMHARERDKKIAAAYKAGLRASDIDLEMMKLPELPKAPEDISVFEKNPKKKSVFEAAPRKKARLEVPPEVVEESEPDN